MSLGPLLLEPQERELIWGGHALVERYGKHASPDATIGESWECYDGNRIASGDHRDATLAQLRTTLGPVLMGGADAAQPFPILTKIIDARAPLSVQVHPGDDYARRVEHQPVGKTECWYILEAEAGASIVLGWNRDTSREEYLQRVADGSLGELLREVPVRAGDVFHLPAGTMHAIGAGIVLFETQQTSDLTYRIFDYNRVGADGKPRPLHVEKAADVLDYRAATGGAIASLDYHLDGTARTLLVADPRFTVERIALDASPQALACEGMPLVVFALEAPVALVAGGERLALAPYQSALVPASLETVAACGAAGPARIVTAAPPRARDALERRLQRAGVARAAAARFLEQF
ncbi:MAG: hypothetical protein NVS1B2_18130 [Vulcanimicrobiaceae bacterium]